MKEICTHIPEKRNFNLQNYVNTKTHVNIYLQAIFYNN